MNALDREAITAAARRHAAESAEAQGMAATIRDPQVLAAVASILSSPEQRAAA